MLWFDSWLESAVVSLMEVAPPCFTFFLIAPEGCYLWKSGGHIAAFRCFFQLTRPSVVAH